MAVIYVGKPGLIHESPIHLIVGAKNAVLCIIWDVWSFFALIVKLIILSPAQREAARFCGISQINYTRGLLEMRRRDRRLNKIYQRIR